MNCKPYDLFTRLLHRILIRIIAGFGTTPPPANICVAFSLLIFFHSVILGGTKIRATRAGSLALLLSNG